VAIMSASPEMLTLTPRYYTILGRAAEIALVRDAESAAAEHLFLAMLHDGGWPVSVLTAAAMIDLGQLEDAVVAAMNTAGYASAGTSLPGGRTARDMGDTYIGVEHAFLAIIRDRASLPSLALAGLADLDEVEAAVLAAKNASPRAPDDAVFLPDGQELDAQLRAAIVERLPAGASFGFNTLDGRIWVRICDIADPDHGRDVINAALDALDRP
jgi:ATP-dependent Clp protease ATP-binding subunit ClpA